MRMKLTHAVRFALILIALVSQPLMVLNGAKAKTAAPAPAPQTGENNLVGSFKLHVQIQQRRVEVKDEKGGATQLLADFAAWDAQSRVAAISVAVKNVGAAALNGSLDAALLTRRESRRIRRIRRGAWNQRSLGDRHRRGQDVPTH